MLALYSTRIIDAVNTLAKNAGVAAVGKVPTPPPIDSITVAGSSVNKRHYDRSKH